MPLSLTEFNHFYIINKVTGKQRHYLESLLPRTQVTILSELNYVVMVKGSKIDKSLQRKLLYTQAD